MFDDPKNVGTCTFFYQDSDYSNYSGRQAADLVFPAF